MASKKELQTTLKAQYGINLGITSSLTMTECQDLLISLENQESLRKIVNSFSEKTSELGNNNRSLGLRRKKAEEKYSKLKREYDKIEVETQKLEKLKRDLEARKQSLTQETDKLEKEIRVLSSRASDLSSQLTESRKANNILKRENRDLKNINDALKLGFAKAMNNLMSLENSEIRKGIAKLASLIGG